MPRRVTAREDTLVELCVDKRVSCSSESLVAELSTNIQLLMLLISLATFCLIDDDVVVAGLTNKSYSGWVDSQLPT